MHKGICIAFVLALLLVPSASASVEWYRQCTGGILYQNTTISIDGVTKEIWNNVSCHPLDCSDNGVECMVMGNVPIEMYMSIAIGLGILAFVFAFISVKLHEDNWALSMLFLFNTLFIAITAFALLAGFNVQTQDTVANVLHQGFALVLWSTILFLAYYLLQVIVKSAMSLMGQYDKLNKE